MYKKNQEKKQNNKAGYLFREIFPAGAVHPRGREKEWFLECDERRDAQNYVLKLLLEDSRDGLQMVIR